MVLSEANPVASEKFGILLAITWKWCKIGGKLVLITNGKSYMGFWLVPKSVSLTFNGVMAVILHYFAELGSFHGQLRKNDWLAINNFFLRNVIKYTKRGGRAVLFAIAELFVTTSVQLGTKFNWLALDVRRSKVSVTLRPNMVRKGTLVILVRVRCRSKMFAFAILSADE